MKTYSVAQILSYFTPKKSAWARFVLAYVDDAAENLYHTFILSIIAAAVGALTVFLVVKHPIDFIFLLLFLLIGAAVCLVYIVLFCVYFMRKLHDDHTGLVAAGLFYVLFGCTAFSLAVRGGALLCTPDQINVSTAHINEQIAQQRFLKSLRPGDAIITKDQTITIVTYVLGLHTEMIGVSRCAGTFTTQTYDQLMQSLQRVVHRRDVEYHYLSERFLAAEKCPVGVK